ncbi:hypothetical protein [Candidatus Albibeggiatoa sp. nov. NOAA]|uniref:hypothetical protein n=1 Tax=Candidatus Albibeggiatoa sp. nov. NOAA TaxID=3162724 RepID=UPI0033003740|nr:hypothetical protein [Thiotrichaceae bacterium]
MTDQDTSEETNAQEMMTLVQKSMHDFHESMRLREELSLRIGKRTTQIIRFSMLSMLLLGVAMFYLIYTLTSNMNAITDRMIQMSTDMQAMNHQFKLVVENMAYMRSSIDNMEGYIQTMPQMASSVNRMGDNFPDLISHMSNITNHMGNMDTNMSMMSQDMANMSQQFTHLNHSVGVMGYNVNHLARPMKMMPFP